MSEFSLPASKRIIKSQGDKRVSKDAAKELNQILERFAGDIAEEAIAITEEKGRKTVRAEDIRDA